MITADIIVVQEVVQEHINHVDGGFMNAELCKVSTITVDVGTLQIQCDVEFLKAAQGCVVATSMAKRGDKYTIMVKDVGNEKHLMLSYRWVEETKKIFTVNHSHSLEFALTTLQALTWCIENQCTPIWIDVLNHMNDGEAKGIVLKTMGGKYSKNEVVPYGVTAEDYFKRGWMVQEVMWNKLYMPGELDKFTEQMRYYRATGKCGEITVEQKLTLACFDFSNRLNLDHDKRCLISTLLAPIRQHLTGQDAVYVNAVLSIHRKDEEKMILALKAMTRTYLGQEKDRDVAHFGSISGFPSDLPTDRKPQAITLWLNTALAQSKYSYSYDPSRWTQKVNRIASEAEISPEKSEQDEEDEEEVCKVVNGAYNAGLMFRNGLPPHASCLADWYMAHLEYVHEGVLFVIILMTLIVSVATGTRSSSFAWMSMFAGTFIKLGLDVGWATRKAMILNAINAAYAIIIVATSIAFGGLAYAVLVAYLFNVLACCIVLEAADAAVYGSYRRMYIRGLCLVQKDGKVGYYYVSEVDKILAEKDCLDHSAPAKEPEPVYDPADHDYRWSNSPSSGNPC